MINKFKTDLANLAAKHFPKGYVNVSNGVLGGDKHIFLRIGLIGKRSDLSGGYRQNDPLNILLSFDITGDTAVMSVEQKSIAVKPTNPYMAMGRTNLVLRKTTGTFDKILAALDKQLEKSIVIIKEEIDDNDVYNQVAIPQEYLDL